MTAATATEIAARRARPFMALADGFCLDLLEPCFFDFPLEAIATQLSRINRFVGATLRPITVAQHSREVAEIVRDELLPELYPCPDYLSRVAIRWALVHDVAEIVTGDIPAPVKGLLGREFREIEARLEAAVRRRFSLPECLPWRVVEIVREADLRALARDKRDHMVEPARDWGEWLPPAPDARSVALPAEHAAWTWLRACREAGLA